MRTILAACLLAFGSNPAIGQDLQISGTVVVSGAEPQIEIENLVPGQRIRVHSIRMFAGWEPDERGNWVPVAKPLHAWADFRADEGGAVRLWLTSPLAGTYSGIDGYGIFWSGRMVTSAEGDPYLPEGIEFADLNEGQSRIIVSRDGEVLNTSMIEFQPPPGLRTEQVARGSLNGGYAAPAEGGRYPALILLHGSEGGDRDTAMSMAMRFAGQGYAAFAFNYFAWDLQNIAGVPNAHVNQPIEMLSAVRSWMEQQPETDVERFGLYGHSKGAEYAEVAAVQLPWIDAVAACVPTDVVWQGYGVGDGRNRAVPDIQPPENYSSFSWNGQPLPYIPLEGDCSPFHSNTDFYEAKREQSGDLAQDAAIPVEQAHAAFLWLGGGRDEVWASGVMAQRLDQRMRAAGLSERSELHVYDAAGHGICGDGTYPTRLWSSDSFDPRDPDLDANGRATVDAWRRIQTFFSSRLKANEQ